MTAELPEAPFSTAILHPLRSYKCRPTHHKDGRSTLEAAAAATTVEGRFRVACRQSQPGEFQAAYVHRVRQHAAKSSHQTVTAFRQLTGAIFGCAESFRSFAFSGILQPVVQSVCITLRVFYENKKDRGNERAQLS